MEEWIANPPYTVDGAGCWVWPGRSARRPYGPYKRFYAAFREPIPEGMVGDHLCQNKPCVNPWHIEVVTKKENTLRGFGAPAINARKTRCDHGHEYTPENTVLSREGWRSCRECRRRKFKAINARRREYDKAWRAARIATRPSDVRAIQDRRYARRRAALMHDIVCIVCGKGATVATGVTCSRVCRGKHSHHD